MLHLSLSLENILCLEWYIVTTSFQFSIVLNVTDHVVECSVGPTHHYGIDDYISGHVHRAAPQARQLQGRRAAAATHKL